MHWSANTDTLLSKYPIYVYTYDICKYTNELYTQTIIYTESYHQRMSFLVYLCFRIQHWSYERAWQQVQTRGVCRSSWRTVPTFAIDSLSESRAYSEKETTPFCVVSCRIHQSACLWSCSWRCSGNPREFGSLQACTICRPHWSLILPSGLALFPLFSLQKRLCLGQPHWAELRASSRLSNKKCCEKKDEPHE